jgi:hypothetical protein
MDAGPFRGLGYRSAPAQARGLFGWRQCNPRREYAYHPFPIEISMDVTLVGTAVHVEGLAPSDDPIVATVPALEFVKLLEADVVPTGIAVGVHYEWLKDGMGPDNLQVRVEGVGRALGTAADTGSSRATKERLFTRQRRTCSRQFYPDVHMQTTIPRAPYRGGHYCGCARIVVDLRAGDTPLTGHTPHHESYRSNESGGAI